MDDKNQRVLEQIIDDLKWLLKEAGNYYTIDTLAKKFYLTGKWQKELLRLKKALILYFTIEQFVLRSDSLDKRYASFLAAILNRKDKTLSINDNIKMLSWNYDMQFELTLNKFLEISLSEIQDKYNILPKINSSIQDESIVSNSKKFSFIKLNGNAVWGIHEGEETIFEIDKDYPAENTHQRLGVFLEHYRLSNSRNNPKHPNYYSQYFNFAWENDKTFNHKHEGYHQNLAKAAMISLYTEILVVIGYSFPVFNRKIDKALFSNMKKLTKVYIQDVYPERIKSTMVNAFEVLQKTTNEWSEEKRNYLQKPHVEILLESYNDQFAIPYELNQD